MKDIKVLRFGLGELSTNWGRYEGKPAVFIEPVASPGAVGDLVHPDGGERKDTCEDGAVILQIHNPAGVALLIDDIYSALAGRHINRLAEMSFAYERAAGVIESGCVREQHEDALENGWWDMASADEDLSDEVEYLEARRLLERHPEHSQWVTIRDEGDPLPDEVSG